MTAQKWLQIEMEEATNLIVKTDAGVFTFYGTRGMRLDEPKEKLFTPRAFGLGTLIVLVQKNIRARHSTTTTTVGQR
jgi:hypothetical protein